MYSVFEHVVDKVGIWFNEVSEYAQHLQVFLFLVIECIEGHVISVYIHFGQCLVQFSPIGDYLLISFLDLLLLLL
jgi:hypothetical protein